MLKVNELLDFIYNLVLDILFKSVVYGLIFSIIRKIKVLIKFLICKNRIIFCEFLKDICCYLWYIWFLLFILFLIGKIFF